LCQSHDSNGNRILPNSRLEHMLNAYVENQMEIDDEMGVEYFHFTNNKMLPKNNFKTIFNFPKNLIIEKHDDEVWHLELSSSYKYLATCSKNGMISIFLISTLHNNLNINCISYFATHKKYVSSLNWSKNEKFILTSSADKTIKFWDPFEGKLIKTFQLHTDIVTSVKWLNEETFVSGGIDKKMVICTTGNRVLCSETFTRISKVLFSQSQNCLIIIPASMNDIIFYDYKNYTELHRITELDPIISSNLSVKDDGRFLITNLSKVNASINLYDMNSFKLVNKFYGHTQDQYTIEASFAGRNDEFIVCGSEDAQIYIWNRNSSIAIAVIKGQTGSVNNCSMRWIEDGNEIIREYPVLFSVSDDFTLRVWSHLEVIYQDSSVNQKKNNLPKRDIFNINEVLTDMNDNESDDSNISPRGVLSEGSD
jgi:WD40 repeat protein